MKKHKRLTIQVIAVMVALFIISAALSIIAVYMGSRDAYLTAKNTAITRDLDRTAEYFRTMKGLGWYLGYWENHPAEVTEPMTDEEIMISDNNYPVFDSEEEAVAYLESISPEYQLAFAKDTYSMVKHWLEYGLDMYDYEDLYLIDINSDNRGFVFFEANREGSRSVLGDIWDYEINIHPAVRMLMSGNYSEVEFEIVNTSGPDGGNYYIGYLPFVYNGKISAALCIAYNWEHFRGELLKSIIIILAILVVVMLIASTEIILLLRRLVTDPIGTVQESVQNYINDKDSGKAVKKIETVNVNNEIGSLASNIGALILDMDKYTADIKTLSKEVMESLARTIDAKDKYTNGHSERVAVYSRMLAKKLGLTVKEQENIYYMGLLHDIGKIGIPHDLISKTSGLTDEEYRLMKNHTIFGYEILSEIDSLPELAKAARWHHECYDGTGYPDSLAGDNIPFVVRIIAVADSYDAMTSNRSYRQYLPQDVVRAEIEKYCGTQFDPQVGKAMLDIIDMDRGYQLHE